MHSTSYHQYQSWFTCLIYSLNTLTRTANSVIKLKHVHKKHSTPSSVTPKTNLNKCCILYSQQNIIIYPAKTEGSVYTSCLWSCQTAQLKLKSCMQTWSRTAMQWAILKEITRGFFRTLPNTVLKEVAGVWFEPPLGRVGLLKELFQVPVIAMHMMTREIISGWKQRARWCPL